MKFIQPFFDAIDVLLKTIPVEEIQFQQTHSKQQLAKVVAKLGARDLEKVLDKMVKKINKNLQNSSTQKEFAQQVWTVLTDYFLGVYEHAEKLTIDCYTNQRLPVSGRDLKHMIESKKKDIK